MDFIIQKAVELGVHKIVPLITERCNVRLNDERLEKRLAHWQSVVISACEQSGRHLLPEMDTPICLNKWLPCVAADCAFVLSPHVQNKLPTKTLPDNARVTLLIGSEGGLSEQEVAAALKHGFLPLNLGPRVLRTETATIAAVSILQFYYGDMSTL
jgi:16S rRNA (uracil1498-N3)-methyltransferase